MPHARQRDETERDHENGHEYRENAEYEADDAGDIARGVHAVFFETVRLRKPAVGTAHGQAHNRENETDDGEPCDHETHDTEHHCGDGLLIVGLLFRC